ncbi:hypothetical protein [Shewanella sp. NFH-SH190041]|uniref:hypothetical protein n=1 Tax=Shewanella sp. NFH-SH190041 TaxID=2950245 RepID=UPI0021C3DB3D|nr:hypothetical protein [Shewanella sp. NFH-SH190041]
MQSPKALQITNTVSDTHTRSHDIDRGWCSIGRHQQQGTVVPQHVLRRQRVSEK